MQWLDMAFPHGKHFAIQPNMASSGATVEFNVRCNLATRLDEKGGDLVVIEEAINMASAGVPPAPRTIVSSVPPLTQPHPAVSSVAVQYETKAQGELEQMIRHYVGVADTPAIVMLNWFQNPMGQAIHRARRPG
eukprot:2617953-Prymnesium_polylepis.1